MIMLFILHFDLLFVKFYTIFLKSAGNRTDFIIEYLSLRSLESA